MDSGELQPGKWMTPITGAHHRFAQRQRRRQPCFVNPLERMQLLKTWSAIAGGLLPHRLILEPRRLAQLPIAAERGANVLIYSLLPGERLHSPERGSR